MPDRTGRDNAIAPHVVTRRRPTDPNGNRRTPESIAAVGVLDAEDAPGCRAGDGAAGSLQDDGGSQRPARGDRKLRTDGMQGPPGFAEQGVLEVGASGPIGLETFFLGSIGSLAPVVDPKAPVRPAQLAKSRVVEEGRFQLGGAGPLAQHGEMPAAQRLLETRAEMELVVVGSRAGPVLGRPYRCGGCGHLHAIERTQGGADRPGVAKATADPRPLRGGFRLVTVEDRRFGGERADCELRTKYGAFQNLRQMMVDRISERRPLHWIV